MSAFILEYNGIGHPDCITSGYENIEGKTAKDALKKDLKWILSGYIRMKPDIVMLL